MLIRLILDVARHFLFAGTLGFFGIGMSPDKNQKGEFGAIKGIGDFATSQGQGDILASDNFWKGILSGDPGQISKVLGPEISGINKRAQESKKTSSEFGNRGGGTNAGNQMIGDKMSSEVSEMYSALATHAAGALGGQGSGLLSQGASAHGEAFGEATTLHQESMSKTNDIFKSITSLASAFVPGGAGAKLGKKLFQGFSGGSDGGGDTSGSASSPYS